MSELAKHALSLFCCMAYIDDDDDDDDAQARSIKRGLVIKAPTSLKHDCLSTQH